MQSSTSLIENSLQSVPAVAASPFKDTSVGATHGLVIDLTSSNICDSMISLGIIITPLRDGSNLEALKNFPTNLNGKIEDVVKALSYLKNADYDTCGTHYFNDERIAEH